MINAIWLFLIASGVVLAVFKGTMEEVSAAVLGSVSSSVELFLGLVGVMALWMGLMRIAEKSGLVGTISRGIRPVMHALFPAVPPNHPAMGAMVMNVTANMLGLGNAATPLGINAMKELQKLNPRPSVATNAMCTFLVINTSSVQLIPATVIGLRLAADSGNPTEIVGTALIATTVSTLAGIISVKALQRLY
ncbi:MAG: Spore maturation protein A [Firmicutes bacterium]|nr:Spore maturation protein A [Bacillota bacterium]MDI6705117.1 nucleoside recognition domain-containing protein [Bacillota bacterium]